MLIVVHTKELGFLRGAQLETRNKIDDFSDDGGHDKGIGGSGDDSSDLPSDKFIVVVEKAANGAAVDSVETNDATAGEKTVEDEANHATDTVLSEYVERVVDADEELDCENMLAFLIFNILMAVKKMAYSWC